MVVVKRYRFTVKDDSERKKWYIFTMAANDTICPTSPAFQRLMCNDIYVIEGIALEDHIFLVSQLPCCAQLALPYWAKITGRVINNRVEEMLLAIVVTLFDSDGLMLTEYSDVMALDEGQRGEFEVKLVQDHDRATTYALTIKETEQF